MRQTSFNDGWKFYKGDVPNAEAPAFNDYDWRGVTLPHDWSIEGPFDPQWASATGFLPGGVGWYRKAFTLPSYLPPRRVFLHFDGVYCNGEVWINGHYLGKRPNGFASFRHDLTPFLRPGGENVVAVKVDHTQFADARWYTGSGINRNVWLLDSDPVHVKQWGIFATAPVVRPDYAEACVSVDVQNEGDSDADVQVEHALYDGEGMLVAETATPLFVPAQGEQTAACQLAITQPRLWSVEQPNLYRLHTVIRRNGEIVDEEDTTIGLRAFRFDADQGFFLNSQPLKWKGVCLHDDAGALGTAVPPKVWERRLRTLKAAGVNAVRMAHNPHAPELYDLCDRLGLMVQDEAFDEWELGKRKWKDGWNVGVAGTDGPHEHFAEWGEADLRDMVLRDRNHPSILTWSIGNEIDYPNDPYTHEVLDTGSNPQIYGHGYEPRLPHADRLGVIARRLVEIVKALDPTRPVTAALAAASVSNLTGFAEALDVVGYNYQEYRYPDDHVRTPGRVLYGSENGHGWEQWAAVADNPFISGQFLWTGIDYLGEAGTWPSHGNGSGLLDLAGLPKPLYHFRRSLWTTEPMAYLGVSTPDQWSSRNAHPVWAGTPGEVRRVGGFTNCASAELFLNGRSLGAKAQEGDGGHVVWWDVHYESGTLTLNGLDVGGDVVAEDSLKTSGPAHRLLVEADALTLAADGLDLAHVLVTVVDEDGIPVFDADHEITWAVTGPARLLGVENGDHARHEEYGGDKRSVFHGRLLGYVQSLKTPGEITVTLTAPSLQAASLVLQVA